MLVYKEGQISVFVTTPMIGYNSNVIRQSVCLVNNPNMVYNLTAATEDDVVSVEHV